MGVEAQSINLSSSTPAAPSGNTNITFQYDASVPPNVSAYVPSAPVASTTAPSMDGTASYGSSAAYARADHVHPTDTSKLSISALPTSAAGVATNGSNLPQAQTAYNLDTERACANTSDSGTAQSCTTSPSFTVLNNSCIEYTTTTANSGTGLTVNVNSLGAKSVAVPGSSGYTTTLTTSPASVPANTLIPMCYNSTAGNWQVQQNGVAASGGGSYTLPAATSTTLGGVKPDGTTIANSSGAISCATATTSQLGCVKPDGTSITISSGVISATASTGYGGVSLPSGYSNASGSYTSIFSMPSIPANATVRGRCVFGYSENATTGGVQIAAQLSQAPSQLSVIGVVLANTYAIPVSTNITGTSQTLLVSGGSASSGAEYAIMLDFTLQNGSSANVLTFSAKQSTTYTATIYQGSYCSWLP